MRINRDLIKAAMEYGHKKWQTESWDNSKESDMDFMAKEVQKLFEEKTETNK